MSLVERTKALEAAIEDRLDTDERLAEYAEAVAQLRVENVRLATDLRSASEAVEAALATVPPTPEPQVCQTSWARGWIAARRTALAAFVEDGDTPFNAREVV